MAISIEQREYVAHIVDLLQFFGPVESKSLFGGFGVFLEGLMFGLIAGNELYLKVDGQNRQDYKDLGLQAFSFRKNGKQFKMSYYQTPHYGRCRASECLGIPLLWRGYAGCREERR